MQAGLADWLEDWRADKLEAHVRSQAEPATQDDPVYQLVSSAFARVVLDPSKDVLVLIYFCLFYLFICIY